jgi:hypothetical protein
MKKDRSRTLKLSKETLRNLDLAVVTGGALVSLDFYEIP